MPFLFCCDVWAHPVRRYLPSLGAEGDSLWPPSRFSATSPSRGSACGRGGDFGWPFWPPCLPPISCSPSGSFSRGTIGSFDLPKFNANQAHSFAVARNEFGCERFHSRVVHCDAECWGTIL